LCLNNSLFYSFPPNLSFDHQSQKKKKRKKKREEEEGTKEEESAQLERRFSTDSSVLRREPKPSKSVSKIAEE
jgi:hypothetical protein